MKLKNYLAMMAIALCAVACSDDDNKKEDTVIPAQEVAGTYNGTLSLSVSGNDQGTSDSQVKITAEEGGTVQVLLVGSAGEGMMSLPDIAIPGIKVQTSDNVTYTFPESAIDVTVGTVKYTGRTDPSTHSGTIYIDATDYRRWTFIDFHTQKVDSVNVTDSDQKEPEEWDIAVHRYDVKTNAGAVLETGFTGFSALQNASAMPEGVYVDDVWTTAKVAIDMSGMMDGNIVYMESYYNEELSKWLNVDKSNMPPTYTLSNKVYMVKLKDGTYAAVRLTNYMNASGVKGFMTIDYIYPFEL